MEHNEETKCCICGKTFKGWGNNPWPVMSGKDDECCHECNVAYVIPARLKRLSEAHQKKLLDEINYG